MPQQQLLQKILKPLPQPHAAVKAWIIAKPAAQVRIRQSAEAKQNHAARKVPAATAAKVKAEQTDARTSQAQPRQQLLRRLLPLKSNQGNYKGQAGLLFNLA